VFLETNTHDDVLLYYFSVPLQIAIDDVFATHTQKTENVVFNYTITVIIHQHYDVLLVCQTVVIITIDQSTVYSIK
jgi:hypothetical protein